MELTQCKPNYGNRIFCQRLREIMCFHAFIDCNQFGNPILVTTYIIFQILLKRKIFFQSLTFSHSFKQCDFLNLILEEIINAVNRCTQGIIFYKNVELLEYADGIDTIGVNNHAVFRFHGEKKKISHNSVSGAYTY